MLDAEVVAQVERVLDLLLADVAGLPVLGLLVLEIVVSLGVGVVAKDAAALQTLAAASVQLDHAPVLTRLCNFGFSREIA